MKLIALSIVLTCGLTTLGFGQKLDARIASINGPCAQIVGSTCYSMYSVGTQDWFGSYSFNDKTQKVTLVEKFDCHHPNGRQVWGSAGSDPKATFPVYNSKKVKGLYASCYGVEP